MSVFASVPPDKDNLCSIGFTNIKTVLGRQG